MKTSDFDYDLDESLIAHAPLPERTASRLLCLDKGSGKIAHKQFTDIIDYINKGDVLVLNDTKVIPARLYGRKPTGGKLEILIERIIEDGLTALAHIRGGKGVEDMTLSDGTAVRVLGRKENLFIIEARTPWVEITARLGEMPLPPYIERQRIEAINPAIRPCLRTMIRRPL